MNRYETTGCIGSVNSGLYTGDDRNTTLEDSSISESNYRGTRFVRPVLLGLNTLFSWLVEGPKVNSRTTRFPT